MGHDKSEPSEARQTTAGSPEGERSESMTNECPNPNAASVAAPLRGMGERPVALRLARGLGGRFVALRHAHERGRLLVNVLGVRATPRCSVVPPLGGSGSQAANGPLPDPEPPKGGTTIRDLRTSPRWELRDTRRRTFHHSTIESLNSPSGLTSFVYLAALGSTPAVILKFCHPVNPVHLYRSAPASCMQYAMIEDESQSQLTEH